MNDNRVFVIFHKAFFSMSARVSVCVSILNVRARPLHACKKKRVSREIQTPRSRQRQKTPLNCEYVTVLLHLIIIILVHLNNEQLHFVCVFFVTAVEKLSLSFARYRTQCFTYTNWSSSLQPRPRKDRVEEKSHIQFMLHSHSHAVHLN